MAQYAVISIYLGNITHLYVARENGLQIHRFSVTADFCAPYKLLYYYYYYYTGMKVCFKKCENDERAISASVGSGCIVL